MSKFEFNIVHFYGERGKAWLQSLPQVVEACMQRYGLSELAPFPNLTHNYVLSGLQGSRPIVLKLGLEPAFLKREACALDAYDGVGAVKLLDKDEGVLLLERVGDSLKALFPSKDDEAARIVCSVMNRLHQAQLPVDGALPSINKWLAMLDRSWPIPLHYLHKARELRDQLLADDAEHVLLHGDLHHDNILQHGDKWIAIDPKGIIGEPTFEVAAFMRNPIPDLLQSFNAKSIINRRINIFADVLALSAERILNWCFVQAVLCWVWALEDHGHPAIQSAETGGSASKYFAQLTEIFHNMR